MAIFERQKWTFDIKGLNILGTVPCLANSASSIWEEASCLLKSALLSVIKSALACNFKKLSISHVRIITLYFMNIEINENNPEL